MSKLTGWTAQNDDINAPVLNFEKWLTNEIGVSNDCLMKLKRFGIVSISILKACTESDIEDLSIQLKILKIDKV